MSEYISALVQKYRASGIVIDSNILLLLVVGSLDRTSISKHRRTHTFTPADFDLLVRFLSRFKAIVTSPNVLTEVSNLLGQSASIVRRFAIQIEAMEEHYFPSREAARHAPFVKFGLADSVIAMTAQNGRLVLTDDFRLAQTLEHEGVPVLNFNHLRDLAWSAS